MSENYINGAWRAGAGDVLTSTNPATGEIVWQGASTGAADVGAAVDAARAAFAHWGATSLEERLAIVRAYADVLTRRKDALAEAISRETGKPRWEGQAEAGSMIAKVAVSITAQAERAGTRAAAMEFGQAVLRHRPHGVMAVLGPYNFPGHLPNGHIVPALLAGNTVVFKPSELTPAVGRFMAECWAEAGLPAGVFNLVQGARATGEALVAADIDGLLFTGSAATGAYFRRAFADRPNVILALELGGNNPLIAWDGAPKAVASIIVQSAFITTGQRCSCARRLIVPTGAAGDAMIDVLVALSDRLRVGAWDSSPEPFMGPLISLGAAQAAVAKVAALEAAGAKALRPLALADHPLPFVRPAILLNGQGAPVDDEIFAPVLQITRVATFDDAIHAANNTAFGLAAGVITDDDALWERFILQSRAGIVNRNRPTTGAAANMPFGGLGASGNHRPSAYYAADYCAYPVGSFEAATVTDQSAAIKGLM